jgi:hypothetical protein
MLDAGQREQLKKQLNDLLYKMIAEDRRVEISTTSDLDHVERLCGYRPDYLPKGEPVRLVTVYGPFGRPCKVADRGACVPPYGISKRTNSWELPYLAASL